MKKIFCTTTMVLGLLVSIPALAVENEEIPDRRVSGSGPTATGLSAPATSRRFDQPLIRSADFIGNTVRGAEGNEIGTVSQLLFDAEAGQVRFLVVSAADGEYLVPWSAVTTDPEGTRVALDIPADQFKNAPKGIAIGSEEKAEELHRFYGVAPHWKESPGASELEKEREPMRQNAE